MADRLPLNGRIIAEYYVASESAKRSKLRQYARPEEEQAGRIIFYDHVRKALVDYFRGNCDGNVLERTRESVLAQTFKKPALAEQFQRNNLSALAALETLDLGGDLSDVVRASGGVSVSGVLVNTTAAVYATFAPRGRAKPHRIAIIVNPAGIPVRGDERVRNWWYIESEVVYRVAMASGHEISAVLYVDLKRGAIERYSPPRVRVWNEIDATCERLLRDWREVRLERSRARRESS